MVVKHKGLLQWINRKWSKGSCYWSDCTYDGIEAYCISDGKNFFIAPQKSFSNSILSALVKYHKKMPSHEVLKNARGMVKSEWTKKRERCYFSDLERGMPILPKQRSGEGAFQSFVAQYLYPAQDARMSISVKEGCLSLFKIGNFLDNVPFLRGIPFEIYDILNISECSRMTCEWFSPGLFCFASRDIAKGVFLASPADFKASDVAGADLLKHEFDFTFRKVV